MTDDVTIFNEYGIQRISRRQLIQTLGMTAGAALMAGCNGGGSSPKTTAQPAAELPRSFKATVVNHLSYGVKDFARVRDFYVDLCGMRVVWDNGNQCALDFGGNPANSIYLRTLTGDEKPSVSHISFAIENFSQNREAVLAEIKRRNLQRVRHDSELGWIMDDPNGYMLNITAEQGIFPGAARPCEVWKSASCDDAREKGLKNLSAAPKPSGKGFKAYAFGHIVLNVPDVAKSRDFYRDMLSMNVIYDQPGDMAKNQPAQAFLRFGENTLCLRQTKKPDMKPFVSEFSMLLEDYDQARVAAELKRRRLNPQPASQLAWMVHDPEGMSIGLAGKGLAEQLASECGGSTQGCRAGARA